MILKTDADTAQLMRHEQELHQDLHSTSEGSKVLNHHHWRQDEESIGVVGYVRTMRRQQWNPEKVLRKL